MGEIIGEFFVPGRARTKGSLKPIIRRGRNGKIAVSLVEDHELSVPWKKLMIKAIREQTPGRAYAGPVEVRFEVCFAREYVVSKGALTEQLRDASLTPWPTSIVWGDGDKLERNLWDALTQSGLIEDDRWVVAWAGRKRWCEQGEEQGLYCVVESVE